MQISNMDLHQLETPANSSAVDWKVPVRHCGHRGASVRQVSPMTHLFRHRIFRARVLIFGLEKDYQRLGFEILPKYCQDTYLEVV